MQDKIILSGIEWYCYVQEILSNFHSNLLYTNGQDLDVTYYMSPILYSNLLYKMCPYFLDIQYQKGGTRL